MTDKHLVIYISRDTNKYNSYNLISKEAISKEELLEKIENFNKEEKDVLAVYHEDDIFTDFVKDMSGKKSYAELIKNLKDTIRDINSSISDLEDIANYIQEIVSPEELTNN